MLFFCILFDNLFSYNFNLLAILFNCHQIKSRSITFKNWCIPICARYTGIVVGTFISIILIKEYYLIFIILGLPLIIDGVLQQLTPYISIT